MEKMERFPVFFMKMILLISLLVTSVQAQDPEQSVINVNNITSWVRNDGFHPLKIIRLSDQNTGWNGSFPKGSNVGSIYSEGLVWGGKVLDGTTPLVRVNGSTYIDGNEPIVRLFRVRTYYKDEDLTDDAASFFIAPVKEVTNSMVNQIYKQYEKDWEDWPAEKGAPFYDANKNGVYEPDVDIPGIPASSQTIWINYNDASASDTYGSPPTGLEVQETYWAYENEDDLSNVIYKHARLIYKGTAISNPDAHIDSMYIVQWVDTDVGYWVDDFAGCDTALNLGYVYNSSNKDSFYSQILPAPPAVGYAFLQGVSQRIENSLDSAIVNFRWRQGYKYVHHKPMTVFLSTRTGDTWTDPYLRDYDGTLEFYNLMRGYLPRPPYPSSYTLIYPKGEKQFAGYGTYNLDGDPVTGTGWIDGIYELTGDRRIIMVDGPFSMKKGDTAEVVIALVGGIDTTNLKSISSLKHNVKQAAFAYKNFVHQMTTGNIKIPPSPKTYPENYVLYQNYPNPFNSYTVISYDLPEPSYVKLIVYDILGREIRILVNENKDAGSYKVRFYSEGLPSGVYFYRISFENQSNKITYYNLTKTNKLILIK